MGLKMEELDEVQEGDENSDLDDSWDEFLDE